MKVRVVSRSFVDNVLVEEGAILDYDGELGANLEECVEEEEEKPKKKKQPEN